MRAERPGRFKLSNQLLIASKQCAVLEREKGDPVKLRKRIAAAERRFQEWAVEVHALVPFKRSCTYEGPGNTFEAVASYIDELRQSQGLAKQYDEFVRAMAKELTPLSAATIAALDTENVFRAAMRYGKNATLPEVLIGQTIERSAAHPKQASDTSEPVCPDSDPTSQEH